MIPDELVSIAKTIASGGTPPQETVRDLLSWFGAKRRGPWIVRAVRQALRDTSLTTEPDFESTYIDGEIAFLAAPESEAEDGKDQGARDRSESSQPAGGPEVSAFGNDPAHRISRLESANKGVVSVPPTAPLAEAVTLMLASDFSQLPVMPNERDVKGVVSWRSIGQRLALESASGSGPVQDFMDPHHELRTDESIFSAITVVAEHDYVLVRAKDRRITGLVTAADLTQQFRQLAEPFLLLGEIENSIRGIIDAKFGVDDLQAAQDSSDEARTVSSVADLTFGEYVRLLSSKERWGKIGWKIERDPFISKLDRIREIRNSVMHFDPDGVPEEDLDTLRAFSRFLQKLQALCPGVIESPAS